MNTEIIEIDPSSFDVNELKQAGVFLREGKLVAFPTETVYGLGANALDGKACEKIFHAKGRPQDNPLIVHIAEIDDIERFNLVSDFPEKAKMLAEKFWPGPLTIIMNKSDIWAQVSVCTYVFILLGK